MAEYDTPEKLLAHCEDLRRRFYSEDEEWMLLNAPETLRDLLAAMRLIGGSEADIPPDLLKVDRPTLLARILKGQSTADILDKEGGILESCVLVR
jgi:hypothetical protein